MENLTRREREKLVREEEIIATAERIFCQKGFDNASMDEIAKEAQFTKRTLYQYFENKEDLYFAVVLKKFKSLSGCLEQACINGRSGFEKIQLSMNQIYQLYKKEPEAFRVINYVGYVKRNSKDSKKRSEFLHTNHGIFETVAKIVAEGMTDGSIRNDLNAPKTAFSLVFLITGFFNQLSATGATFTDNFSLDIDEFSLSTLSMILETLKSNNHQSK